VHRREVVAVAARDPYRFGERSARIGGLAVPVQ
jgi:hypothetical protein